MAETISLNFRQPVPLFPLNGLVVLPHAAQGLHIFEPRYRQMVEHCLARVGEGGNILQALPIAMANYDEDAVAVEADEPPPLRPVVCVTKIIRRIRLPDGRFDLVVHGVCRARIRSIIEPEGPRLFRQAMLEPLERHDRPTPRLPAVRRRIRELFAEGRLSRVAGAGTFVELALREEIPTSAFVEIVSAAILNDSDARYRMLAEPDLRARARLLGDALRRLDGLLARADVQAWREWPKGMSWN
jgi:Lon protease-like protein